MAAAFGLGFSGIIPAYVLALRELFPASEAYWRIPTLLLFSGIGMALGGWLAGMLYDHFGYYAPAFAAGIGANMLNMMIIGTLVLRGGSRHEVRAARRSSRLRHQPEHVVAVHLACVGEQRLHRGDEGVVFCARQFVGSRSRPSSIGLARGARSPRPPARAGTRPLRSRPAHRALADRRGQASNEARCRNIGREI